MSYLSYKNIDNLLAINPDYKGFMYVDILEKADLILVKNLADECDQYVLIYRKDLDYVWGVCYTKNTELIDYNKVYFKYNKIYKILK
jgi:hypothetical protein